MIKIRHANQEDIPQIMKFYATYWDKKNSIMGRNRQLFEYQHLDEDELMYYIGEDEDTKEIYGAIGYIKMNQTENPDIFSTMVKSIKNSNGLLGFELGETMMVELQPRLHLGVGINLKTSGVVAAVRGSTVVKQKHFYRLNDLNSYKVAEVRRKEIPSYIESQSTVMKRISSYQQFDDSVTEEELRHNIPYKDKKYIRHRYFQHPFYQYQCWMIEEEKKKEIAFLFGREIQQNDTCVLRIVDFIGNDRLLEGIGKGIQKLIDQRGYEYVDFYCYGIETEILKQAGFVERMEDDDNIIPNYFEPFVQKNVEIYCAIDGKPEGVHIYKGDSDQDRPNIL